MLLLNQGVPLRRTRRLEAKDGSITTRTWNRLPQIAARQRLSRLMALQRLNNLQLRKMSSMRQQLATAEDVVDEAGTRRRNPSERILSVGQCLSNVNCCTSRGSTFSECCPRCSKSTSSSQPIFSVGAVSRSASIIFTQNLSCGRTKKNTDCR
jgi:hypothetical protein